MAPASGVLPEMLGALVRRAATEPYPAVPIAIPKGFRGAIALSPETCIGCSLCAVACPTVAIEMIPDEADVAREGKTVRRKRRPTVHVLSCIRCGLCEEVCPTDPKSIFLTPAKSGSFTSKDQVVR